jgi:ferredoxin
MVDSHLGAKIQKPGRQALTRVENKDPEEEKTMAKEPWVDQDVCISCGLCVTNVPEVFRFAESGTAECYDPHGAPEEVIQTEAVDVCPVSCIHWRD